MASVVAASVSLALGIVPASASAAAPAHLLRDGGAQAANTSSAVWYVALDRYSMWYNPANGLFSVSANDTPLSPAVHCNGQGYCEHTLPNGKCMEWESGPNDVSAAPCSGIDRQLWELVNLGGGFWEWLNYYADSTFKSAGYCYYDGFQYPPALTAEQSGLMDMRCSNLNGSPGTNQQWTTTR